MVIDRVKQSQSEILVINRNIANNLKKIKWDFSQHMDDYSRIKHGVSLLIEQGVCTESLLQTHLSSTCSSGNEGGGSLFITATKANISVSNNNNDHSVLSSNMAPKQMQAVQIEKERVMLSRANDLLRRA